MTDEAKLDDWYVGATDGGWLYLDIVAGPLATTVKVDSRTARELAIDIIGAQSPYLLFQPPNDSMKERRDSNGRPLTASSDGMKRRRDAWWVGGRRSHRAEVAS